MGSADLNNAVREVIFGENKVCGLTRTQDVKEVYANGALYGGLNFRRTFKTLCEPASSPRISDSITTSFCGRIPESRKLILL